MTWSESGIRCQDATGGSGQLRTGSSIDPQTTGFHAMCCIAISMPLAALLHHLMMIGSAKLPTENDHGHDEGWALLDRRLDAEAPPTPFAESRP